LDLPENKVFVILWKDATYNIGRFFDGINPPPQRGFTAEPTRPRCTPGAVACFLRRRQRRGLTGTEAAASIYL
jgi:hypothetical protein